MNEVTPGEAKRIILDALADLPSGPPGDVVLAVLLAAAWEQGYKTAMFDKEYYSFNANPYRK